MATLILVGIGANLPSSRFGPPRATCEAALGCMAQAGVRVEAISRWYLTSPVPASDQPSYVNGVARVATDFDPRGLLSALLGIERQLGRERAEKNAPRVIDLDLLAYDDVVSRASAERPGVGEAPNLPHPRLHQRAFVLLPIRDIAPGWRHPATGQGLGELIDALGVGRGADQIVEVLEMRPHRQEWNS